MNAKEKEKLRWFQLLSSLYEIAIPHIEACIGVQCRAIEERTVDCEVVTQNTRVLQQLLSVISNIPTPQSEELIISTKKYFEAALSNCICASEALVHYVQVDEHQVESQIQLDNFINSIVLAREYSESTHKKLNTCCN